MEYKHFRHFLGFVLLATLVYLGPGTFAAWGQTTTGGTLNVSVVDPSGAAVPNAGLELKDLSTNVVRRSTTQANGVYAFSNLPGGTYSMTVSAQGFSSQVFESVVIRTSLETDVKVDLKVGVTSDSITVTASEVPIVQTEASALSTNFDTKQVFNLPQLTRSAMSLVYDVPGYASGTFNNLPGGATVSAEFDGTQSMSNRFRDSGIFGGYGSSVIDPRLENIAEFTVTTSQLDLGGSGTSAMKISIVTKRGTNQFHGLLYEDFRNTVLNANSWSNNATVNANGVGTARSITKYNNFGGTLGGPIWKNKVFFFGSYSMQKNPNTSINTRTILNPLAQQGIYQYLGPTGAPVSVDLFSIAKSAGLQSVLNPVIKSQLAQINGIVATGLITPNASDPNTSTYTFTNPSTATNNYPMFKIDWNQTDKLRFTLSYSQQKSDNGVSVAPNFPGMDTLDHVTYSQGNNKIIGLSTDYAVSPTIFNNLRLGYLYQFSIFDPENLGIDLPSIEHVDWSVGTGPYSSSYPRTTISSLYSVYSVNDTLTWQRGKHSLVAGFSGFREWDRYWNGPGGWPSFSLGINSNDPAYAALNNAMPVSSVTGMNTTFQGSARSLYATLIGDVSGASIAVGRPLDPKTKQYKPFGQYNLNEVQQSEGFWLQDRWRILPNLTLNYGIRWDIVGDDHDKDGAYTSAKSLADIWGPTSVGALFQPGTLGGIGEPSFTASVHKYNTSWKNPQPAIAIAWNPEASSGILGKIVGRNKTVIRAGYSLRNYQDGAQNIWAFGSNGMFFYQGGSASPDPTATGPGYFKPGSLTLATPTPVPNWLLNPQTWSPTIMGTQMFGSSEYAMNPNIRLPYVQSWNFGIQRELGASALEINYVGNLTLHTWTALNLNEVNIFETGFLSEFKNAQSNLAINQANGKGNTPFNYGLPGEVALPIFTTAFGSAGASGTASVWTGLQNNLTNGAVGSQARTMVSTTSYLCNMIGSANFAPCASQVGANVAGSKPLNFWQINPYAKTGGLNYLDASGMANYEALQAQWRTRLTHGALFTFSYTLAHSLANGSQSNIQSQGYTPYTLRNLHLSYQETGTDIRQALRVVGTFDLPFGKGKMLANRGGIVNAIVGGWTLGTITSITTATPTFFGNQSGYATVDGVASGINLMNGTTAKQFQDSFQQIHTGSCTASGCNGWVQEFTPYLAANGTADPNKFVYNTTPGTWGVWPVLRGPLSWSSDASVTKRVAIHENYKFMIQATATNVFNHPNIGLGSLSLTSTSFGRTTPSGSRSMVLRANIEF
jgi:hypothetical protein